MKLASTFALLLFVAGSSVASAEVRTASEAEIAAALIGCWAGERTAESIRDEDRGLVNARVVCFGPQDQVEAVVYGGSPKWALDAVGSAGTFRVIDGRLKLTGNGDGWFFGAASVSCDVVMRPDVAMRLENCIGSGGEALPNTSYGRQAE